MKLIARKHSDSNQYFIPVKMVFPLTRPLWHKLFIVVGGLPFIALCFYNQPYLDDYWTGRLGRDEGIWQSQAWLFTHWTGRFATTAACVGLNPLSYGWTSGVKLTALLNICLKLGVLGFAIRHLTGQRLPQKENRWLAAGLALTYACLVPDKYATIYSFTDWAVYQLPALLLVLVPVAIDRMQRAATRHQRRWWSAGAVVGTVAAAGSNEMTIVLMGWVLAVGFGVSVYRRQRQCTRIWAGLLVVLLVAGGVTVGAPGNYQRLKTYGPEPFGKATVIGLYWARSISYIFTQPATLLTLGLPLLLRPLGVRLLPARPPGLRMPLLVGAAIVFGGTVLGALPYSILEAPFERPVNVLEWWLLLGWLLACWASLPASEPPSVPAAVRHLMGVLLVVATAFPISRAWMELVVNAPSYASQWQERHQILRKASAQGIKKVTMAPILHIRPFHTLIRGYDNQPDARNIRNVNVAAWYGLDSVRTNPRLMPSALF